LKDARPEKADVLAALVERVRTDRAEALRSQHAAQHGATHVETRAEDPKDTRATEASSLARGLAERAESLSKAVAVLEAFHPPAFGGDDAIALGALVALEDDAGEADLFFLVPAGGGENLDVDGRRVRTLSPRTPLGARLLGLAVGDEVSAPSPRGDRARTVVALR
jgi:transcription elongation GreA/GreB family factor